MVARELDEVHIEELRLLRAALEEAIARQSLRQVAKAVGMSPSGLHGLRRGAVPYAKTWERLRVWYTRRTGVLVPSAVAEILRMMLRDVPDRDRPRALREVVRAIEAAHGARIPAWLVEVRGMLEESES